MSSSYHIPVLASEIAEYLLVNRDGVYIDGTLGGGGHAENFLKILTPKALYIGIDRDSDAIEAAQTRLLPFKNVFFYKGKFSEMENALNQAGQKSADAVLLDLGVSSHQINSPDRGFSFQSDGSLDMRMNRDDSRMAEEIIAHYSEEELKKIFWRFGEERNSGRIARQIVKYRKNKPVTSTGQLKEIINNCVPERFAVKSYARIFQALRIEVNNELGELAAALDASLKILKKGGRLGVISYHSLEDRMVKDFIYENEHPCHCPPEIPVCVCGKKPVMKRIKPFLIRPAEEEIKANPRARSARFRVGEKL